MVIIKKFRRMRPGDDDKRRLPQQQQSLPGISATSAFDKSGRLKPPRLNHPWFGTLCENAGLPRPTHQWRGHPTRKFIYDFAWQKERVVLEVDGGIHPDRKGRRGAHGSVKGILDGMEKSNLTQIAGLLILRVPFEAYLNSETIELVRAAIASRAK